MESQNQSHAATQVPPPLSSVYEWPSKSRIKDRDPSLKNIGSGVRDPLQLWAKVDLGNKEGTGDAFEGAPGSHKKMRDRNQQSQSTPGLDTTSLSGRRHGSLTVQATPPPC